VFVSVSTPLPATNSFNALANSCSQEARTKVSLHPHTIEVLFRQSVISCVRHGLAGCRQEVRLFSSPPLAAPTTTRRESSGSFPPNPARNPVQRWRRPLI